MSKKEYSLDSENDYISNILMRADSSELMNAFYHDGSSKGFVEWDNAIPELLKLSQDNKDELFKLDIRDEKNNRFRFYAKNGKVQEADKKTVFVKPLGF